MHYHTYSAHTAAWLLLVGEVPNGLVVDHACNNRSCVNVAHLRLATVSDNVRNGLLHRDSRSGFKGASWDSSHNKFKAQITVGDKCLYLGRYDTPEEAHEAYCKKAKELFGEFFNNGKPKKP